MTSSHSILIVDDELGIRLALAETLRKEGYQVETVESGEAALEYVTRQEFDLVLLDLNLKGIQGTEVLAALHQQLPDIVVIMLTAYASLESAVEALRQGAQDYLFKPCSSDELRQSIRRGLSSRQQKLRQRDLLDQLEHHMATNLANLRAVMAEQTAPSAPARPPKVVTPAVVQEVEDPGRFLQRGGLTADLLRHVITLEGHLLELSVTEFKLLAYLLSEAPRVVPPQELIQQVLGYDSDPWEAKELIRSHIYHIRQKFTAISRSSTLIQTVRGVGYTIAE